MILQIDGPNFDSLHGTGASDNFMIEQAAKTVIFQTQGKPSQMSMISNNLNARVLGTVCSDVCVQDVQFAVVPKHCADIMLGQGFKST